MRSRSRRGRLPAGSGLLLVPAAAFVVHQLRYTLAYGARANAELAAQGHSYLHSLVPWFVLALGVGLTLFLRRVARALATGAARPARLPLVATWLIGWGGLVGIYVVQESLEALLASGHPAGIGGVFGHGGWWAVPAAGAVAAGVTLLLRLARAVVRFAARLHRNPERPVAAQLAPAGVSLALPSRLARACAGRGPPLGLPAR